MKTHFERDEDVHPNEDEAGEDFTERDLARERAEDDPDGDGEKVLRGLERHEFLATFPGRAGNIVSRLLFVLG